MWQYFFNCIVSRKKEIRSWNIETYMKSDYVNVPQLKKSKTWNVLIQR